MQQPTTIGMIDIYIGMCKDYVIIGRHGHEKESSYFWCMAGRD